MELTDDGMAALGRLAQVPTVCVVCRGRRGWEDDEHGQWVTCLSCPAGRAKSEYDKRKRQEFLAMQKPMTAAEADAAYDAAPSIPISDEEADRLVKETVKKENTLLNLLPLPDKEGWWWEWDEVEGKWDIRKVDRGECGVVYWAGKWYVCKPGRWIHVPMPPKPEGKVG